MEIEEQNPIGEKLTTIHLREGITSMRPADIEFWLIDQAREYRGKRKKKVIARERDRGGRYTIRLYKRVRGWDGDDYYYYPGEYETYSHIIGRTNDPRVAHEIANNWVEYIKVRGGEIPFSITRAPDKLREDVTRKFLGYFWDSTSKNSPFAIVAMTRVMKELQDV